MMTNICAAIRRSTRLGSFVRPAKPGWMSMIHTYGVSVANFRPRLAQNYSKFRKLTRQDAFGCFWNNNRGTLSLRAQAWGREETNREGGPHPGLRLLCNSSVLKKVLTKYDKELLLLFSLQRYEKDTYRSSGRFSHSIGVVLIDKSLNIKYFKGRVNYPNILGWQIAQCPHLVNKLAGRNGRKLQGQGA